MSRRDLGSGTFSEWIALAVTQADAKAFAAQLNVGEVETHKLARAKRASEAEKQHRAIAVVSHRVSERAHHAFELGHKERRRTFLASAVHAADSALERANAWILVWSMQAALAVHHADRDACTADRARLSALLCKVDQVVPERDRGRRQRLLAALGTPALEEAPVVCIRGARAIRARGLHVRGKQWIWRQARYTGLLDKTLRRRGGELAPSHISGERCGFLVVRSRPQLELLHDDDRARSSDRRQFPQGKNFSALEQLRDQA